MFYGVDLSVDFVQHTMCTDRPEVTDCSARLKLRVSCVRFFFWPKKDKKRLLIKIVEIAD